MSACKCSLKFFCIIIFLFVIISAAALCITKPKMHKPFQMNIIEYIMKINADGTTTTTKQVTTTTFQGK